MSKLSHNIIIIANLDYGMTYVDSEIFWYESNLSGKLYLEGNTNKLEYLV